VAVSSQRDQEVRYLERNSFVQSCDTLPRIPRREEPYTGNWSGGKSQRGEEKEWGRLVETNSLSCSVTQFQREFLKQTGYKLSK